MSAWIPAETGPTTGRAPEAPDADLTGKEPTAAKGTCFLMNNGRDGGGVSRREAAGDGGWVTTVLRMQRCGMVGADATGGGGTRVYMRGRRFSFPLKLLLTNTDFFHVSGACGGILPPLASLGEALSAQEKVLVKVKIVDTDAGRLGGCRPGGAAATPATTGVSWC
jgi:hypothetical protein